MKKIYEYNDNITISTLGTDLIEINFFEHEDSLLFERKDVEFLVFALSRALEPLSSNPPPDTL